MPVTYPHEELDAMIGAERVAVTRALRRREEEGAGSSGGPSDLRWVPAGPPTQRSTRALDAPPILMGFTGFDLGGT